MTLDSLRRRVTSLLASCQLFDCWLWTWTQRVPPTTSSVTASAHSHDGSAAAHSFLTQSDPSSAVSSSATQDSLAGLSDDEASYGSVESESCSKEQRRFSIAHTVLRLRVN